MSFILDNNVISELWKPMPDPAVVSWLSQNQGYLPVPVIAEIQEGIEATPSSAKRIALDAKLDRLVDEFDAFILTWDADTARTWGRLRNSQEVKRKPQPLWDSLLDAMAVHHQLKIATRNRDDFRHATTVDPWTGLEYPPVQPAS